MYYTPSTSNLTGSRRTYTIILDPGRKRTYTIRGNFKKMKEFFPSFSRHRARPVQDKIRKKFVFILSLSIAFTFHLPNSLPHPQYPLDLLFCILVLTVPVNCQIMGIPPRGICIFKNFTLPKSTLTSGFSSCILKNWIEKNSKGIF